MSDPLSIHVRNFNEKVRVMNQSQRKELLLTAQEARNLHADIFALLAHIAELGDKPQAATSTVAQVSMDGGGFR